MIEVMKVYLDYQLWDYINKNDNVKLKYHEITDSDNKIIDNILVDAVKE